MTCLDGMYLKKLHYACSILGVWDKIEIFIWAIWHTTLLVVMAHSVLSTMLLLAS